MKHSNLYRALLLAIAIIASGCAKMGPTEMGVRFRKLPPAFGGGVSSSIIHHGQSVPYWPWDSFYRFDTRVKEIEWGQRGPNQHSDYVQTRALDGNEVALAVKVQYSISTDPEKLLKLVDEVATSEQEVEEIITAVARADIRTYMNELRTAEFFDNKRKFEGGERVKQAMQERLEKWGIVIHSVNLGEHRFERLLRDGTIDSSYQEKINEVQTKDEETKRERLRKATVEADKAREFNDMQAEVNRMLAEVEGYKNQAKVRGDAYLETKTNEAKAVLAAGRAEVDGLIEQINALSGPGGEAILKLELAKHLIQANPKFFIMGSGEGSMEVKKVDANELLRQIGLIEAMKGEDKKPAVSNEKVIREGKNDGVER
ncbi:MAG: SPFH domain-containing protein [Deltaproteobacteria bacterium]|nr:SPFH domain-containing protein [Deltaproteobacteria bacterium]